MRTTFTTTCIAITMVMSLSADAQFFPVNNIITNGPDANRVNIAVLPDGYTQAQLPDFLVNVVSVCDTAYSRSPFREYRKFFNVYAIEVPSVESGSDHPATATDVVEPVIPFADVNTYFNTSYDNNSKHRFVMTGNTAAVYDVLANNLPSYDQIIVLVNSPEYGGTGGAISTLSIHPTAPDITVHELGHSFAGLSDEYWAGWGSETPNMTMNNNPGTIKWHDWLNVNGIGIIQHFDPSIPGLVPWYRPSTQCKMDNLTEEFCSVCKEGIINSIYDIVSPIDDASPDTMSVVNYVSTPLNFSLDLVTPEPNTLTVVWKLNGTTLPGTGTTIQVTGSQLNNGANVLKAFVTDTTDLSRSYWPAAGYQFGASWDINKGVTGIEVINSDANSRFFYKVYPVPAKDHVTIDYDNKTTDNSAVYSITDITGGVVMRGTLGLSAGKNKMNIDITGIASGNYIFTLIGKNINVEAKVSKL